MRPSVVVPLALAGAGLATLGYAWGIERKAFRLRTYDVPVLPPGSEPIRVLHLSDMHLTPGQDWKVGWIRSLAQLSPDLVIDTGDNWASHESMAVVLRALEPLFAFPGLFVPGSNDFFAPRAKNPGRYLLPDRGRRFHGDPLAWGALRNEFVANGWNDLTHRRDIVDVGGRRLEVAGVSDPHLRADHYERVAGPVDRSVDVAIGLSHSPEPRVLDNFADDGFRLVCSGHTHGGQLRLPGYGALVTNCGIDAKRARGLSRYQHDGKEMFLHVSAGLGTSPYAPVRFACPPEATLMTLVASR